MYKRIFLLSGLSHFINEPVSPQIGIGYLAECLSNEGFICRGYDFSVVRSLKKLKQSIKEFKPDLLGVHLMSHGYLGQFEIIKIIKDNFPDLHIIVGGPHASLFGDKVLSENRFIDYACTLEGEQTIQELASGNDPSKIAGLIVREGMNIKINKEREFISNLDLLPFPTYRTFDLGPYPSRIISIFTSRGCPYKCTFCPVQAAIGCKYRTRSAENVFEEVMYWYKRGYREIWIQDDNFTLISKRVDDILELILRADMKDLRFALPNGIRSDKVNYSMLKKMKRAGFFHIAFGVEAGNNRILENIKKGEKIETIERAISDALSVGIKVSLFFLIGSIGETENDVMDSFDLAKKHNISKAVFYNIIPFPKTELFDYLKVNNLLLYEPSYYLNKIDHFVVDPIFYTPELNIEKRIELLNRARRLSKDLRNRYIRSLLPTYLKFIPDCTFFILEYFYLLKRKIKFFWETEAN